MDEERWLTCTDSNQLLCQKALMGSDRQMRLFSVACCRRIWHLFEDQWYERAVEAAEAYSDGLVDEDSLSSIVPEPLSVWLQGLNPATSATLNTLLSDSNAPNRVATAAAKAVGSEAKYSSRSPSVSASKAAKERERKAQADLLRCILGNPFRPVLVNPEWLMWNDSALPKLAEAIYAERRFDEIPVLADALEDAGCHDSAFLDHCRSTLPHVRGCWVLDLLLGKE